MTKKTFKTKLANMPVPILATMVGAATLSNLWAPLGYSWIRHITMWSAAIILLCYIGKIIFYFDTFKKEYSNTVPASLYAGFSMITMILGSYVFDYSPTIGKGMWVIGLGIHAVHLCIFLYRNVVKNFNLDTFVPSWFVTLNGIMVSTVVGGVMNEPLICTIIVYYGIAALVIAMPFMVVRLLKHPLADPLFHTKAIVLAPSSLCVVSYINILSNPNPIVVYVLYIVVFASILYVVCNLPKFFSFSFHPGFAGLTFPMAIGTVATNKVSGFMLANGLETLGNILKQIGGIQLFITTGIITFVLFNFLMLLIKSYRVETK